MLDELLLEKITNLIVSIAIPRKVILFGSRANDTADSDSDFDIMVIVKDDVDDLRALNRLVHLRISTITGSPCDILIEHETTFNRRSALPTIERTILETGQTLYAA